MEKSRAAVSTWAVAALIVCAGCWAYANSFSGSFIFDDTSSIENNASIKSLWRLWSVLSPPSTVQTAAGRPILNLSFAFNYALGGLDVWGFHLVNLIIHLLAGLTLFGIARRTFEKLRLSDPLLPATAIALLWTVHPLQTESVTYIVQRAESLMGLFYFLTLYCFIRATSEECPSRQNAATGDPKSSQRWAVSAVFCCLLGMATKEVMASAPVLVLLYDRALVSGSLHEAWRKHRRIYLGMGATWTLLALLVIRGGGDRNGSMGIGSSITFSAYLPTQFPAIGHYLRLSFWPHPLIFEYGPFRVKSVGSILRYVCVVIPLLGATAVALWRWPAWGFLGAWFFAILAPTSLVPGAVQMISEHRMYLPLAAVLSAAVYTAYALSAPLHRVFGARTAGWALLLGLAAACCLLTRARNPDYANTLSIWTDTVAKRPSNALAHNNLAVALDDTPGHTDEVIAQYLEAIRLRPTYAKAENNLGNVLSEIPGRMPEALAHYERALKINPKYADAHYNLALELEDIPSRMPEALAHFETALKLAPKDADIENAYADALATIPGRIAEAVGHYKAALRIDPDYTEARESLEELKELPK